jgi:protein-L-isoaspartate(D-aspartate) O-methyltransferase
MPGMKEARHRLVERAIEAHGISDHLVLTAMRRVPRELFVPEYLRAQAYDNRPLPIGFGQTISQPYIVAYMIEALRLRGGEKVLEIGAGSGYAAAVLAEIAGEVFAIERLAELASLAEQNLAAAGYTSVRVIHADGTLGLPDEAPFDAILISAGAPEVPRTLCDQLAVGGRMVVPVGQDRNLQQVVRVTRIDGDEFLQDKLDLVAFVPLIGEQGWQAT